MTLQRRAPLQRAATLNRLIKAKTVGFIGGLSLLVNAMSGPGIPFVPSLFQVSGWVLPVIAFFVFTIVSSLSVLFIVEAMQAIPGNKHFQGTVEYGTLINFYFGKKAHLLGQFFLCGALLSQAIQSIVLTSQTADDLAFRLTGKTCGLVLSKGLQWKCIQASTFQDWTFLTVGYLGTLVLAIPFFFVNMDNNIQVQICAFFLLFVLLFHWITASILQTTFTIKKLEAIGVGLSSVAGVVLQNLAFTVVVPSWINLKRKDVNAQYTVWSATTIMSAVYIVFGMIAAMGFDDLANNDFMQTMRNKARPTALSLASTYAFTFCMLLPGIPVNLIVAKLNLTQNRVMGKIPATLATFVIPWIVAIPFLRDGTLQGFVDWTSLVFVSTANFVFPIIIYFRCVRFRKSYNADRVLTLKQKLLLKEIHWSSRTIQNFINSYNARIGELDAQRTATLKFGNGQPQRRFTKTDIVGYGNLPNQMPLNVGQPEMQYNLQRSNTERSFGAPNVVKVRHSGQEGVGFLSDPFAGTPHANPQPLGGVPPYDTTRSSTMKPKLTMRVTIAMDDDDDVGSRRDPALRAAEIASEDAVTDSTLLRRKNTKRGAGPYLDPQRVATLSRSPQHLSPQTQSTHSSSARSPQLLSPNSAAERNSHLQPRRLSNQSAGERSTFVQTLSRIARGTYRKSFADDESVHAPRTLSRHSKQVDLISESEAAALVMLLDEDVPDPEEERATRRKHDSGDVGMTTLTRRTLGRSLETSHVMPMQQVHDSGMRGSYLPHGAGFGSGGPDMDYRRGGSMPPLSQPRNATTGGYPNVPPSSTVPVNSVRTYQSDVHSRDPNHDAPAQYSGMAASHGEQNPPESGSGNDVSDAEVYAAAVEAADEAFMRKQAVESPNVGVTLEPIERLPGGRTRNTRIDRKQTLPSHPNFVAPPFRTIPLWLPVPAQIVAHVVLLGMVGFILFNFYLLVSPKRLITSTSDAPAPKQILDAAGGLNAVVSRPVEANLSSVLSFAISAPSAH